MDAVGGFSELASSSLPSLNLGGETNLTWNRSLRDLMGASETLIGGTTGFIPSGNALGPPPIFSAISNPSKKPERFLSVTEILQKRQDEILSCLWQQEEEDTKRRLQEMVDKQLDDDWNRERDKWVQEIAGTRFLGGLLQIQNATMPRQLTGQLDLTSRTFQLQVTPSIILAHLEVVKRVKTDIDIIAEFQNVANTMSNSRQAAAYVTAWRLLSCITSRRSTGSALDAAYGTLLHLAKLFQTGVTSRVQSALLANQDTPNTPAYRNALANKIDMYVRLQLGSSAGVWPVLFYALRCGDAVAAIEILDAAKELNSDGFVVPLRKALASLSQAQAEASCIWETLRSPSIISAQDRQILSDSYEVAVAQEPQNAYRLGVLALLSGKNPVQSSIEGTVEDYLYKELWRAIQETKPLEEIAELGNSIKHFGPGYFEDDEPFGWPYALPLLATQQYSTALSYIADAGGPMGLLQSTHLGLALHFSGIELEDFSPNASKNDDLLSKLLEQYAALMRTEPSIGNAASLEYLVRIPKKERAKKEIAMLVVRTRDIASLAGTLSPEGERNPGALDQHLNPVTVSAVLTDAGNILRKDSYDKGKLNDAGSLFMLAGRYSSILDLLNEMLFPPDILNDDRPYWFLQAQIFHSTYLTKRSRVLDVLEKEGKLPLITVSNMLMKLCLFFDRLRTNHFAEAVKVIDGLQLLPATRNELPARQSNFIALDRLIQESFPAVLKGTLKALYEQHSYLKRESQGRATDTVYQALRDLRTRASVLVTFAGLIPGINSDVRNVMSQMEARMI